MRRTHETLEPVDAVMALISIGAMLLWLVFLVAVGVTHL
jgi:hypothetical protein